MPRCLDPNQRFPLVLDSDKDKPAESRPTFYFRAFSARRWREIKESNPSIRTVLDEALVGWEHMTKDGQDISFAPGELEAITDDGEQRELLDKLAEESHLSPADKKKLELPPSSSLENSAPDAKTESA